MTQEEQILRDALAIIERSQEWVRYSAACDDCWDPCGSHDPAAAAWSAMGAIDKAMGRFPAEPFGRSIVMTDRGVRAEDYCSLRDRLLVALARGFCDWVHEDEEARYAIRVIETYSEDSLTEYRDVVNAFTRAIELVSEKRSKADTTGT